MTIVTEESKEEEASKSETGSASEHEEQKP